MLARAQRFLGRLLRLLAVPDRARAAPPAQPRILLSCNDVDRGGLEAGLRYSPLLEGVRRLVDELGFATVNLSHPYAVFRSAQVKGGTLTLNHRTALLRLAALARRPLGAARARAAALDAETRMYRRLLRRLQPETVIAIQPPLAMCRAAREMGIPVVEAMHGSNISPQDRVFREHMSHPDVLLPNTVLAFDDVTHATYTAWCAGRDIAVVRAEEPWLHACRRMPPAAFAPGGGRRVVVLTLQWGYDGEREALAGIVPNGVLHPALEQAMALGEARGISFWVRLHPIQLNAPGYGRHRRHVRRLARRHANVEVEAASARPLPLLLDQATAHLTMSSSAVGEAAAARVPSLLLCPTLHPGGAHHGFFRELEGSGLVTFGRLDAEAIVDWIGRVPVRPPRRVPRDELDRAHAAQLRFYGELLRGRAGSPQSAGTVAAPVDAGRACQEAS